MKDVHTEHCCLKHGCKYGDEDCTVVTGLAPQSYDCEVCDWEKEDPQYIRIKELEDVLKAFVNWKTNEAGTSSLVDDEELWKRAEEVLKNEKEI